MKTIKFKSNRENFLKELHGLKCNTFRKVCHDLVDNRFKILKEMADTKKYGIIEIHCEASFFKRKIKDITYWDNYVIISWDNPDLIKDFARKLKEKLKLYEMKIINPFTDQEKVLREHEKNSIVNELVENYAFCKDSVQEKDGN